LRKLEGDLAQEMDVVNAVQSPAAKRMKAELSNLQMDIASNTVTLNRLNMPFMIAALLGAAVNWLALIYASVDAQHPLTSTDEWLLIGISVGWFLLIGLAVGIAALIFLLPLSKCLHTFRTQT
jgi:hypothetical protein